MTHDSQMPRFILCSASGSIVEFYGNLCMKMSFRFEEELELMWKIFGDVLMVFLGISLKESSIIIFRNFEASCGEWEKLEVLRQRVLCLRWLWWRNICVSSSACWNIQNFLNVLLWYMTLNRKVDSVRWTFKQRELFYVCSWNCWSWNGYFLEDYHWKWTNNNKKTSIDCITKLNKKQAFLNRRLPIVVRI